MTSSRDVPGADEPPWNSPREVFGWTMYTWAFHGFVTTVATVMLGPYVTGLAQSAVGANGPVFSTAVNLTILQLEKGILPIYHR